MRVLDLFCGLKGWAEPFVERGHEVVTLDVNPRFKADLVQDILTTKATDFPWQPDVILASPPCEGFSVMNIGRNWSHDHTPKTDKARLAQAIVLATLDLIREMKPKFFVIENPRAKLRKMPFMAPLERRTVTYCKYGEKRMKPTDLWGGFPPSLVLHPACGNGDPCHDRAPRGSTTGTQGMDSATAAKIPRALSLWQSALLANTTLMPTSRPENSERTVRCGINRLAYPQETSMFNRLLQLVGWRCQHRNVSWPIRLPGNTRPTVSCLDCGKRMEYRGPLEPPVSAIERTQYANPLPALRSAGL